MNQSRTVLGAIIILFGFSILFNVDIFRIIFPLLLIWLGFVVISGRRMPFNTDTRSEGTEERLKRVVIFSSLNNKIVTDNFQGGELVVIFGAGEVDLSGAKIKASNITLDLVTIFGGIKIIAPETWSVRSEGVGIFGGFDNKTIRNGKQQANVLVKGAAIFGGVEVVN